MSGYFEKRLDSIYIDMDGKIEALNTFVKKMDIRIKQISESQETNPRHS